METLAPDRVLTIRRISYASILDSPQARALLDEYSAECSIPEIGTPNPQRETYARMESSGLMDSFGVFEGEDLVGFATVLVFVLPHYGVKILNVESLFLSGAHRRGGLGVALMSHLEAFAREKQCAGVLYNARAGSRLERLLEALPEYKRTNSVFLWSVA
jgi:GNAT superfamily N-acetyltransferase